MILILDLGNTRLKVWQCRSGELTLLWAGDYDVFSAWLQSVEMPIDRVLGVSVRSSQITDSISNKVQAALSRTVEWVRVGAACGDLVNGYREPSTLGADRWSAMLGAYALSPSFIVASLGTATTVDVVVNGVHKGGYIAPGYELFLSSLAQTTDRVNVTEQGEMATTPGTSTRECVVNSYMVMVLALVSRAGGLVECNSFPLYVLGGDALRFDDLRVNWHHRPELIARGVCIYFNVTPN